MMKQYHLYVFTQESCPPCKRLKEHVSTLTADEQAELDFVPLKTPAGQRTALAEELQVELSPTLVVTHRDVICTIDQDGDEWCSSAEDPIERYVGANEIIMFLQSTLDAYTYCHPE